MHMKTVTNRAIDPPRFGASGWTCRVGRLAAVILVCCCIADARSAGVVRFANGEYPPYCSEALPHHGVWSHLVEEAFALEGFTVVYDFVPWKRAITLVGNGERDGTLAFSKTANREQMVRFSETPLGTLTVRFYYRKDRPFDWAKVEDLKGYRIGLMQGYATADEMEALNQEGLGLTLDYATTEVLNFKKLLAGRIDIFPAVETVASKILHEGFSLDQVSAIATHPLPWKAKQLFVVFPKNSERGEQLAQAFERGMKKLKDNGRYDEMLRDFQNGKYDK
jgi:polar amino acid transport system substrate-binding protein